MFPRNTEKRIPRKSEVIEIISSGPFSSARRLIGRASFFRFTLQDYELCYEKLLKHRTPEEIEILIEEDIEWTGGGDILSIFESVREKYGLIPEEMATIRQMESELNLPFQAVEEHNIYYKGDPRIYPGKSVIHPKLHVSEGRVKILVLSNQSLKRIPKGIDQLLYLEYLDLDDNAIEDLPENLRELKNLKLISMENNKLFKIPKILYSFPILDTLIMSGNPLQGIPPELEQLIAKGLTFFGREQ